MEAGRRAAFLAIPTCSVAWALQRAYQATTNLNEVSTLLFVITLRPTCFTRGSFVALCLFVPLAALFK